ncbi:MAG: prolyl oligopeptidase family serine peptidase [Gammaproteobacteria bacterium]|nr:prolyl oligopeptidase family serine peptidase [Gammaproteobacteria bacterium]
MNTIHAWARPLFAPFLAVLLLSSVGVCAAEEESTHPLWPAYERAAAAQAHLQDRWVLNQAVHPRWIDGSTFWYERETPEGKDYTVVDAGRGEKRPAFDHDALAAALAEETGQEMDASALPIVGVEIEPAAVTFTNAGRFFRFEDGELEELDANPKDPSWLVSPDGSRAVYSKGHNLWLKHLASGEEKQLTTDGAPFYAYGANPHATGRPAVKPEAVWSPDSRYVFTAQTDDRQVKSLPVIDFAPADGSIRPKVIDYRQALPGDEHVTRFRMTIIDTDTGKQTPIHYADLAATRMNDTPFGGNRAWWSADSAAVYFVDILRGEREARVVTAPRDSGITRVVFRETTDTYLELGSNVYMPTFIVPLPESGEFAWYSEKSGWGHLYLHDAATGEEKRALTAGDWLVRDVLGVDREGRELFLTIGGRRPDANPYFREVARVNLDTTELTLLSSGDDDRLVLSQGDFSLLILTVFGQDPGAVSGLAPGGAFYVETRQRPDRPNVTALMSKDGEERMVIEEATPHSLPEERPWPEPFSVTAADGETDIRGVMVKPSDFDDGRSWPVIDYIYGGPQVANVPKSGFGSAGSLSLDSATSLAELGFVVVILDGRGTTERSRAFHEASYGRLQTASNLEDHVAGIRQLGERFPYLDAERVGITGVSGGGYMAARGMLKFPEFFKVGVSIAGNHDQRLFWHSWGERYQGLLAGDNYVEQANLTHAANLEGKLLFIHGMLDFGVHPGGLFQLTQALMDANKVFDLVLMPQAGHALPGYGMVRMWDYFVRHLAGQEPPTGFSAKSSSDYMMEKVKTIQMAAMAHPEAPGAADPAEDELGPAVGVTLETDAGNIEVAVYPEAAPESAGSFLAHVDQGLFDGGAFYRVVRRSNDNGSPAIEVIQGGLMDPSKALPPVAHETTEETGILHADATLSLGRTDPGTASGGAFFVTIGDQPSLDFGGQRNPDGLGFAAFGRVTSGMDVVHGIHQEESTAPTDNAYLRGQLLSEPVTIRKAYRQP